MTLQTDGDGLVPVPTVAELASRGLARQRAADSAWTIDAAGYAAMSHAMALNAATLRNDAELRRRLEAAASKPLPRK